MFFIWCQISFVPSCKRVYEMTIKEPLNTFGLLTRAYFEGNPWTVEAV